MKKTIFLLPLLGLLLLVPTVAFTNSGWSEQKFNDVKDCADDGYRAEGMGHLAEIDTKNVNSLT